MMITGNHHKENILVYIYIAIAAIVSICIILSSN